MFILCGIILFIVGCIMLRFPDVIYEITESWKSYSSGEPSDLYRFSTRIGGAVFILVGISALVAALIVR